MIIEVCKDSDSKQLDLLINDLKKLNMWANHYVYKNRSFIIVDKNDNNLNNFDLKEYKFIKSIKCVNSPYKLINKEVFNEDVIVKVNNLEIGTNKPIVIIGGPCSIINQKQSYNIAESLINSGVSIYRGGVFKPRTSPYSFLGLQLSGIEILNKIKKDFNIPIVSEVMSIEQIKLLKAVDILQVGARNMQNFELLKALALVNKPILLKRGFGNTIEEWLAAAEYIVANGNDQVILCERGIRSFEDSSRNTLDLSVIETVKRKSTLPIIVDPSHAVGKNYLVEKMALAALVAGADGIMIEVMDAKDNVLSDKSQALTLTEYHQLVIKAKKIAKAIDRDIL